MTTITKISVRTIISNYVFGDLRYDDAVDLLYRIGHEANDNAVKNYADAAKYYLVNAHLHGIESYTHNRFTQAAVRRRAQGK